MTTPEKLAVYYGWPSAVNGAGGDVNTAAAVFKDYDSVVFGTGLEDPAHGDHTNTISIINHADMVNTDVYGYIDATLSTSVIQDKIDKWYIMGIKGIFLDQFGYDFAVSREHQNEILWCVHEKGPAGLKAVVNAWDPDHVFGSAIDVTYNPTGVAPTIAAGDTYLLESYQIVNGAYQTEADWRSRSDKVASYKPSFPGTLIAAVTTYDASAFDQEKADYSYYSAVLDGLDSWGWGEENYSSVSASLPFRTRKIFFGDKYTGAITQNGNLFERTTNIGIHIDTSAHTVTHLLD